MGNHAAKNLDPELERKVNNALQDIKYNGTTWKGFLSIILCYINVYLRNNGHSDETYRRILDIYLFCKDALNVVSNTNMTMDKEKYLKVSLGFIQNQLGINLYDEQRKIIAEHMKIK